MRESNDFALIHLVIGVNSVSLSTNQMQNKDQYPLSNQSICALEMSSLCYFDFEFSLAACDFFVNLSGPCY